MSNANYGQNAGQGGRYGQYNPYAQQNDQYDPSGAYRQQAGYGGQQQGGYSSQQTRVAPPPGPQTYPSSNYAEEQSNQTYEMGPMTGRAVSQQEPTTILDACREMHRGIDSLEEHLKQLDILYTQRASETRDVSRIRKEIENISNRFIDASSGLKDRIEKLAKDPQSKIPRNAPQVGRVYRRLQDANNQFQQLGLKHRNELRAQKARDMRTVNPEATEEQIQKAVDNEEGAQIFRIAVMESARRDEAQTALFANEARDKDIKEIERSLKGLTEISDALNKLVIEQGTAIENIEQQGEVVVDHVAKANVEMEGAITNARSARRKKFWCLGIALLLVIIIVVVVVVVVLVLRSQNRSSNPAPPPAPSGAAKLRVVRGRELDAVRS